MPLVVHVAGLGLVGLGEPVLGRRVGVLVDDVVDLGARVVLGRVDHVEAPCLVALVALALGQRVRAEPVVADRAEREGVRAGGVAVDAEVGVADDLGTVGGVLVCCHDPIISVGNNVANLERAR